MFIVNESYCGGGSWRTATCPGDTATAERAVGREQERQDEGSFEGARSLAHARARELAPPIYAPVTEPSGAIKLAL